MRRLPQIQARPAPFQWQPRAFRDPEVFIRATNTVALESLVLFAPIVPGPDFGGDGAASHAVSAEAVVLTPVVVEAGTVGDPAAHTVSANSITYTLTVISGGDYDGGTGTHAVSAEAITYFLAVIVGPSAAEPAVNTVSIDSISYAPA